jgi:hypothetical protein
MKLAFLLLLAVGTFAGVIYAGSTDAYWVVALIGTCLSIVGLFSAWRFWHR